MAAQDVTTKKPETMTDHQRLVALRLLDRRLGKVKKLWNGKVSECKTAGDHLLEAATPEADADCRIRIEQIKSKLDELDTMKRDRKAAVDAIKTTMSEILYAVPATAEQLELGATRMPITKVAVVELRAAYNEAVADDAAAAEKGETPKLPPEKAADMDDLRARLDAMVAESGLGDIGFAQPIPEEQTNPDADAEDEREDKPNTKPPKSSKGRGNLSAVPTS